MRFIAIDALSKRAIALYQQSTAKKTVPGIAYRPLVSPNSTRPLLGGFQDKRAEFFLQAQFFSVVLEDRAWRGILIHRNVLPAKGTRNHLHDGENLRPFRPAQAEPDPRSVAAIDQVAHFRIPRDGYALPTAGTGESSAVFAHAASPSSASSFALSKPTTFSSPMKITGVARMLALWNNSSRASSS